MSIELYIFPTSPEYFSWVELKSKFLELLTLEDTERLGTVSLLKLGSNEIVADDEQLFIPSQKNYRHYYLSMSIPNTLGIGISENKSSYLDEFDFLEDFGRNLDAATIKTLAQKWHLVGRSYIVTTNAGRSRWEPPLFVALAAAIAHLCKGYVIVMSDNFTLDVGVYKPNVFQQAKMTLARFMQ